MNTISAKSARRVALIAFVFLVAFGAYLLTRPADGTPSAKIQLAESDSLQSRDVAKQAEAAQRNSASVGTGSSAAAERGGQSPPFFPIWTTDDARDVLRAGDPLERILTPTSEADQAWMLSYAYPRPTDYRARSLNELERAFANAGNDGRPLGQSSRDYAANAVAAAKWEAKDPTWREWAQRSHSPFSHALQAADAMQRFRANSSDPNIRLELQRAISSAYARGERALALEYLSEASRYTGYFGGPIPPSQIDLFEGFHEIDLFNARMRAAGVARPPMRFEPRPAPVWSLYGERMTRGG